MCGMHVERVRKYGDPNYPVRTVNDPVARFWAKVDKRGADECWPWGGVHVPEGYGQLSIGRTLRISAHRFSYELLVGPIPDGAEIDHVKARGCTRRDCVNPAHLEAVTGYVNLMRSDGPSAINKRKELCKDGHEFDIFTVGPNGRPRRKCSICRRRRWAEANARNRQRYATDPEYRERMKARVREAGRAGSPSPRV